MWDELLHLTAQYGANLPADTPLLYRQYYRYLIEINKKINLTSITAPQEVLIKHFLDSLMILTQFPLQKEKVLDVGSGAGLPGVPLKIALPELSLTLLDSLQKRINFLQQLTEHLELTQVKCLHGRAEDLARKQIWRESFDFVLARAVARLNVLTELCLPFVRVGGFFVAYKGPEGENELQEAEYAISELGGKTDVVWHYELPRQMGARTLIAIKKVKPTSARFPRKAGLPAKRPLTRF